MTNDISNYWRLFCLTLGLFAVLWATLAHAACTDPERPIGTLAYNQDFDVFQGCVAGGWVAFHAPDSGPSGPTGCDNIGDVCSDGSVYAGLSPDGNVPMYIADADEPTTLAWGSWGTERGTTSTVTGQANTAVLAGFGQAAHPAAYACANKSAHGHSDWYLPAQDELNLLWVMINTHGVTAGLHISGSGYYWTSTEASTTGAGIQRFSDGTQPNGSKSSGFRVRCVRR